MKELRENLGIILEKYLEFLEITNFLVIQEISGEFSRNFIQSLKKIWKISGNYEKNYTKFYIGLEIVSRKFLINRGNIKIQQKSS